MRCEHGAYYARGRLVYRCPEEATHELVDDELVYLQWCDRHTEEVADAMTAGGRGWRVQPIRESVAVRTPDNRLLGRSTDPP